MSLKVAPFERLRMVSYYCSLVTLSLKCTVFEIFDFKTDVTLKTGLGVRQDHWKCHYAIETFHDFLLTFYSNFDSISFLI